MERQGRWAGLAFMVSAVAALPLKAQVTPLLSIKVTAPPSFRSTATTLPITIAITNISGRTLTYDAVSPGADYRLFEVSCRYGNRIVPETPFARMVHNRPLPTDPPLTLQNTLLEGLQPGETFVLTLDLRRLFQFEGEGQYTVRVTSDMYLTSTTGREEAHAQPSVVRFSLVK